MALGVGVHGGMRDALASSGLLHLWAHCGEGGCEVAEGLFQRCARKSHGDGEKVHSILVFLEGRDEGEIFLGLLYVFDVAAEIFRESDFNENEGAKVLVDVGLVQVGNIKDASSVYEVRRSAMSCLEES